MATRLRAVGHETGAFVGAFPLDSRSGLDSGFAIYDDRVGATGQSSDFLIAERPAEAVVKTALQWLADRTLAFLHWMLGQVDAATATLQHALTASRLTLELQTQLGVYLAETGRARDAVRRLEPLAAARGPQAPVHLLNALGIAYARAGNPERALATFQALVEQDPDNGMGFENIEAAHLELGDLDGARIAFQRAAAIAPTSSRAHTGLGVVRLRQGNRDSAIASWTRAVEFDPQNYHALYNLGAELIKAGRPAAARPHLERFVRSAPPAFYADDIDRLSQWLQAR